VGGDQAGVHLCEAASPSASLPPGAFGLAPWPPPLPSPPSFQGPQGCMGGFRACLTQLQHELDRWERLAARAEELQRWPRPVRWGWGALQPDGNPAHAPACLGCTNPRC
jgi:hypothetical protein